MFLKMYQDGNFPSNSVMDESFTKTLNARIATWMADVHNPYERLGIDIALNKPEINQKSLTSTRSHHQTLTSVTAQTRPPLTISFI